MVLLTVGLFAGAAFGAIVMAFLAIAAYDQGYEDATQRRGEWRIELQARHRPAKKVRSAA
jgi:hypothetical protein